MWKNSRVFLVILLIMFIIILFTLGIFYQFERVFIKNIVMIGILLGLFTDIIRAYYPKMFKPTLIMASTVLAYLIVYKGDIAGTSYLFYLIPSALGIMAYGTKIGLIIIFSLGIIFTFYSITKGIDRVMLLNQLVHFIIPNLVFLFFSLRLEEIGFKREKWLEKLHTKINELSLLKEVSTTMQKTSELKKINKIILTAITAGYGLGFNRALLFLVNKDGNNNKYLRGEMAIGPLSQKEAYSIWGSVVRNQTSLNEVIAVQDELDLTLNEYVSKINISVMENSHNPLIKVFTEKIPLNIVKGDKYALGDDLAQLSFVDYAIVPLLVKNEAIGVILVDNKFNGKKITYEDIDSLTTFANQSALAMENTILYEKITQLADTDGLTGLYNHRYFKDKLTESISLKKPFALLVIDVDDFKKFNEEYGHTCGDTILGHVGEGIKSVVGKQGIACRYGGDEFTVILPMLSKEKSLEMAKEIQFKVREISEGFNGVVSRPLTLSIGLALYPEDTANEEDLFKRADGKLKYSKISGKNTVT